MKLIQKQLLKGLREFEIVDDIINVRIRTLFKEEKISVMLPILNPEPVINKPYLEFLSRVNGEPLLSILIDRPNTRVFNDFVEELKRKSHQEYKAFAGLRPDSLPEGIAANSYEEPPEFDAPGYDRNRSKLKPVNVASIDNAIIMLNQYLDEEEIEAFLSALGALKQEPENDLLFSKLFDAFEALGPRQGAVLTYAPYVGILLSDQSR